MKGLVALLAVLLVSALQVHALISDARAIKRAFAGVVAGFGLAIGPLQPLVPNAMARPEGVNRPELLPKGAVTPLIDVGNFLAKGQEKRVVEKLNELQKKTGFKLRVLCQAYPETPGLAIKDYWGLDDDSIVLVVDRGEGFNRKGIPSNIINLNIGKNVELAGLSNQFWNRVTNKLGNQPYVKAVGADAAVINTVEAITYCLAAGDCTDVPFDVEQY